MALQDFNTNRQYTKYTKHVDDSHERISANTVNKIQTDIVKQQIDSNTVKDNSFEERVYTIFDNNLYVNAMFIDCFKNANYVDLNQSTGISFTAETTQAYVNNTFTEATLVSKQIYSSYGTKVPMNDFFLVVNEVIPVGAKILYFLETNEGSRFPIAPNSLKLPMHLTNDIEYGFKIVCDFYKNSLGESPLLNGYAILYWDARVEDALGMINPDLRRFPSIEIGADDGLTILIRDRAQEDKLVKVLEPLDTVNLVYDWANNEGRLGFVHTNWANYYGSEINQIHKLYYGDYLNSEDEIDNVLMRVRQSTDFAESNVDNIQQTRSCKQCPVYDTLSEEMAELLASQNINTEGF